MRRLADAVGVILEFILYQVSQERRWKTNFKQKWWIVCKGKGSR